MLVEGKTSIQTQPKAGKTLVVKKPKAKKKLNVNLSLPLPKKNKSLKLKPKTTNSSSDDKMVLEDIDTPTIQNLANNADNFDILKFALDDAIGADVIAKLEEPSEPTTSIGGKRKIEDDDPDWDPISQSRDPDWGFTSKPSTSKRRKTE